MKIPPALRGTAAAGGVSIAAFGATIRATTWMLVLICTLQRR